MSFIAKGTNKIVENSDNKNGVPLGYYRRQQSDGSFIDVEWGSIGTDFESAIINSVWTTYGSYRYLVLGNTRKTYTSIKAFDRNMRFDTSVRFSSTVVPADSDISNITYLHALVKGTVEDDITTIAQTVIDEYSTQEYTKVLAITELNQAIDNVRAINIDYNDIKTFAGGAETTMDYNVPIGEVIYIINVALGTNSVFEQITSLSMNVYQQQFIEFFGNTQVAPGTIGKTEINPNYLPEHSISSTTILVNSEDMVVKDGTDNILVVTPDYLTQFTRYDTYQFYFNLPTTASTPNLISLGYFDNTEGTYIPTGERLSFEVPKLEGLYLGICLEGSIKVVELV